MHLAVLLPTPLALRGDGACVGFLLLCGLLTVVPLHVFLSLSLCCSASRGSVVQMPIVDGEQFVDEATSRHESVHHSPSAHHCKLITTCVEVQTEEISSIIMCANDQEDDERDGPPAFNLCTFRLMPPKPNFSLFLPDAHSIAVRFNQSCCFLLRVAVRAAINSCELGRRCRVSWRDEFEEVLFLAADELKTERCNKHAPPPRSIVPEHFLELVFVFVDVLPPRSPLNARSRFLRLQFDFIELGGHAPMLCSRQHDVVPNQTVQKP